MKLAAAVLGVSLVLLAGCGGGEDDGAAETQPEQATTTATGGTAPPKNRTGALEEFIELSYEIAAAEAGEGGQFREEDMTLLRDADRAWQEYVDRVRRPKTLIAKMMVQAYGANGLDQPENAVEAAEIVAQADPSAQAYLELTQHAARAGQTRKASLAGKKAIELASRAERAEVRLLVEQALLAGGP